MRWLVPIALAACSTANEPPTPAGAPAPAANFELVCLASNTSTAAQMQCLRTDTRNGEVVLVDYMHLPITAGPALESGPPGRFRTACAAPSSAQRADLYCVRLDTHSGDLMLLNLTQIGQLPPKKP